MRGRALFTTLLLGLASLLTFTCTSDDKDDSSVQIGVLLPLTGSLSSYGETSKAALEEAATRINSNDGTKVELTFEDTKTDPAIAAERLSALGDRGVKVVLGPYASSEVREAKATADTSGIILISPLSTSRSLAIADDNVLRFTPDDEQEGIAMAALAWADGTRVILPVTRDDEGNKGLQSAMKATFESYGGAFLPTITYATDETDFRDEAQSIAAAIKTEHAAGRTVGVYLTAFNEVTGLFRAASAGDPVLTTVTWYGSDSVALSKELVEDPAAGAFAVVADYPNPILGLDDAEKPRWGPVTDKITSTLGRTPDAFALAAYDGLDVAYAAMSRVGADADPGVLRAELLAAASGHEGLTGSTILNAAGDRASANYDFWSVCSRDGSLTWVRSAIYTTGSGGQAVRQEAC
jgi:branched-chain amino acid transport system substrate-binding protein